MLREISQGESSVIRPRFEGHKNPIRGHKNPLQIALVKWICISQKRISHYNGFLTIPLVWTLTLWTLSEQNFPLEKYNSYFSFQ